MSEWLEFAKGPLFRFSFAVMLLGLARLLFIAIRDGFEAKAKARDKELPSAYVRKLTVGFVLPIRAFRVRPVFGFISVVFHIGLLATPILLFDHNLLFQRSIGASLIALSLPKNAADVLAAITIISATLLLLTRIFDEKTRFISKKQDYLWLILLLIPFVSGFVCANLDVSPSAYNYFLLAHILSGEIIFIAIPFTKIAHCVLAPLSQWITARAWKFPPEAGEKVLESLGKEGEKL